MHAAVLHSPPDKFSKLVFCLLAGDAIALELAAAEMAQAAAVFVALEKEMDKLKAKGADGSVLALKDTARYVNGARGHQYVEACSMCLLAVAAACNNA